MRIYEATFVALLVVALAGCTTAREELRRPVTLILGQLDAYEEVVKREIREERAYYAGLRTTLVDAARREVFLRRESERMLAISEMTDVALVAGDGVPISRLASFLASNDDRFDAALAEQMRQEAEASALEGLSMAKLSQNRKAIAAVRSELVELLRELSLRERATQYVNYFKRVRKHFEQLEESAKNLPAVPTE